MEVLDLGELSDAQRAQLEGDEHDPFDAAGVTLEFRAKEQHVALAEGGRGATPMKRVVGADTFTPLAGAALLVLPSEAEILAAARELAAR